MWKVATFNSNPKKSGIYLVTQLNATNKSSGRRWIGVCRYDVISDKWYCTKWEQVIAWKPLPEIFKGEWKDGND